jgi:hypothetical protein
VEALSLVLLILLGAAGYAFRSYVGAIIPAGLVAFTLVDYLAYEPVGDEIDVLPAAFLVVAIIGLVVYLGGVALGRHRKSRQASLEKPATGG